MCPGGLKGRSKCPARYHSSKSGASCELCPLGKYNLLQGSPECLLCPEGSYCVDGFKHSCNQSEYSERGFSSCLPCPYLVDIQSNTKSLLCRDSEMDWAKLNSSANGAWSDSQM